jgi:hypothetical protein
MTSLHSPPATERSPLDAGILRSGILALIALVRPSPRTPLPRQPGRTFALEPCIDAT